MNRNNQKQRIRLTALCAVLAALGVVLLLIGSLIESLDLSAAMFASFLITIAVIEGGGYWPWLTYSVVTLISLLLLPNKLPAVAFLLYGYYPIVKEKLERIRNRAVTWFIKLVSFNLTLIALCVAMQLLFTGIDFYILPANYVALNYIVILGVGNLAFVLYDVLLTRIIILYIAKIRNKIGFRKK